MEEFVFMSDVRLELMRLRLMSREVQSGKPELATVRHPGFPIDLMFTVQITSAARTLILPPRFHLQAIFNAKTFFWSRCPSEGTPLVLTDDPFVFKFTHRPRRAVRYERRFGARVRSLAPGVRRTGRCAGEGERGAGADGRSEVGGGRSGRESVQCARLGVRSVGLSGRSVRLAVR